MAFPLQLTCQQGASRGTSEGVAHLRHQVVAARPIPMTTEPTEPKPRRRWFQFSLRTFFVLLTVACVWLEAADAQSANLLR